MFPLLWFIVQTIYQKLHSARACLNLGKLAFGFSDNTGAMTDVITSMRYSPHAERNPPKIGGFPETCRCGVGRSAISRNA
jgi:hypothetical protein